MQYSCSIAVHIFRLSMSYVFNVSSYDANGLLFTFISKLKAGSCHGGGSVIAGGAGVVGSTTYGTAGARLVISRWLAFITNKSYCFFSFASYLFLSYLILSYHVVHQIIKCTTHETLWFLFICNRINYRDMVHLNILQCYFNVVSLLTPVVTHITVIPWSRLILNCRIGNHFNYIQNFYVFTCIICSTVVLQHTCVVICRHSAHIAFILCTVTKPPIIIWSVAKAFICGSRC